MSPAFLPAPPGLRLFWLAYSYDLTDPVLTMREHRKEEYPLLAVSVGGFAQNARPVIDQLEDNQDAFRAADAWVGLWFWYREADNMWCPVDDIHSSQHFVEDPLYYAHRLAIEYRATRYRKELVSGTLASVPGRLKAVT